MAGYKDNLLGEANSFLEVLEQVSHLAPLDKPVLIIGERGTGKELIANRLHFLSTRSMKTCSTPSYLVMKQAHLLARKNVIPGALNAPMVVRSFWMSWRPLPCWFRKNCCG